MKLLVVEGNPKEIRERRKAFGIDPYYKVFTEMLQFLLPQVVVDVAFPADEEDGLPNIIEIQDYNGVLITGSSLSVVDQIPEVTRQLAFIDTVFESGTPIYGSCWGLQVATVVTGGKVGKSTNGLELGISKPVELTEAGKQSPFFKNRQAPFEALCIHYDEIIELPENATVLAKNVHSAVQAMTIDFKNASFFGVQYHPEFTPQIMAKINRFLSSKLIDEGYFTSEKESEKLSLKLEQAENMPKDISNYAQHTQEVKAWLLHLNKK